MNKLIDEYFIRYFKLVDEISKPNSYYKSLSYISSLSLIWLAYHHKDEITKSNQNKLEKCAFSRYSEIKSKRPNYFIIPALEAAHYCLTDHEISADYVFSRMHCENSYNREFAIKCASFITPRIDFQNEYLLESVKHIFDRHQIYRLQAAMIIVKSQGEVDDKKSWFLENTNIEPKELNILFDDCTERNLVTNFFTNTYDNIQFFLIENFIHWNSVKVKQLVLFKDMINSELIFVDPYYSKSNILKDF